MSNPLAVPQQEVDYVLAFGSFPGMSRNEVAVFFYGLFMDEGVLASKGIHPGGSAMGYVVGYRLRIGRRATLVPDPASRAYGVLMTIDREQATVLYSEESVSDYVPETVSVMLLGGRVEAATCYNLPASKLEGTNPEYARSLLSLAQRLGFPKRYLDAIRAEADPSWPGSDRSR